MRNAGHSRREFGWSVLLSLLSAASHGGPAALTKERLIVEPTFCKLFEIPANLQSIVARHVDGDGEDLLVVPIQRSECKQ